MNELEELIRKIVREEVERDRKKIIIMVYILMLIQTVVYTWIGFLPNT